MTTLDLVAVAVALAVSGASSLVAFPLLRRAGVIDRPGARSSHGIPTVRGLGVSPLLGILSAVAVLLAAGPVDDRAVLRIIGGAIAAYGVLGLVEDVRGIPVIWRAGAQFVLGLALGVAVVMVFSLPLPLALVFAVAAAGFVNVANFLDGVNGISTFHAFVFGLAFAAVGYLGLAPAWLVPLGWILAAAFLAFLPWNIRGRAFLGDVGSYVLGSAVVALALCAWAAGAPLLPLVAPLAIYLADAAATLGWRILRGERWYESHRSHTYHRLEDLGWRHLPIAAFVSGLSACCAAIGIAAELSGMHVWGVITLIAVSAVYLATPRLLGRSDRPAISIGSRIVFVETTDLSVEFHLSGLLKELNARGSDVHVIARDTGRLSRIAADNGVTVHRVEMARDPSPLADLRALVQLTRELRRLKPPMVVYGTPKASLLTSLAGRLARVPLRVYLVMGLRAEVTSGARRRILLTLERLSIRSSSHVVAVGDGLRSRMQELGLSRERIDVIGGGSALGVDTAHFAPGVGEQTTVEGIDPSAPTVGFVGRITADKGIAVLLDAMRLVREEYPEAQLLLVGPHEDFPEDELRSADGTVVVGDVDDPARLYQLMSVFCLPSLREGLPTVLLEAAASGIPIVTSDVTGARDVVRDGDTGIVVPVGDAEATAKAIRDCFRDPAAAATRAQKARADAVHRFDRQLVLATAVHYYEGVLDGSIPPQRRMADATSSDLTQH